MLGAMGVRPRNGNDRLRTIWSPEMDRYFIDLLLEQVSKGNKFDDHLFSKRAWKHMTTLFNAKFRFECEKDVLKNRHKTLRNLYKAVKRLLDHEGFNWDSNRQMVTADNNVWDEYIKVYPNARAFRIKTIPYYRDLCLIYGDGNVKENFKISDENEMVPDTKPEITGDDAGESFEGIMVDGDDNVSFPKGAIDDSGSKAVTDFVEQATPDVNGRAVSSRTRTYWQPPMDRCFIDLMLDQLQKGNQFDGVFRKQAWVDMIAAFNFRFGFNYDLDVLKNRYKTLRRQYHFIKNLLELEGFSWDDTRQMVTADDYVWQDYIKGHTDARQYMTRPVPYYKDLCVICNDQNDGENDSFSDQYFDLQNDVPIKFSGAMESANSPVASTSSEDKVGELHTGPETIVSNQKSKRQLENQSSTSHPKKSRGKEEGIGNSTHEMATTDSFFSDKRKDEGSSIPIELVVEAIQALPDMDEDLVLDACDFLEDETKAKTFMALDVKLRKKWLLRKLRSESQNC